MVPADTGLQHAERHRTDQGAFSLDARCRLILLDAIRQVCLYRGWVLFAAHVRTSHVHAVVDAEVKPERVMNDFKAYGSRNLTRAGDPDRKRWARHGSTRWLLDDRGVREAIRYVVDCQGEPMAVFNAGLM
jgi:hypothetical protein